MITVEYSVKSKHLASIAHELLFSVSKRRFMIPAKSDRTRLIYNLKPGRYIKFSLFALPPLNSAMIKLTWVNINTDGRIEENTIFMYGLLYSELGEIEHDFKAPKALVMFIKMRPSYNNVAHVYKTDVDVCDPLVMIDAIKYYLENKKTEVEDL